jgi:hypothetical protein
MHVVPVFIDIVNRQKLLGSVVGPMDHARRQCFKVVVEATQGHLAYRCAVDLLDALAEEATVMVDRRGDDCRI